MPRPFRQIRIDLARLDALMKLAGELVVARNRLVELARAPTDPELVQVGERISRLVGAVQAEVLAARLTPVSEVFERFPRVVRDLARDLGQAGAARGRGRRHRARPRGARRAGRSAGAPGPERGRPRHRAAARAGARRGSRPRDGSGSSAVAGAEQRGASGWRTTAAASTARASWRRRGPRAWWSREPRALTDDQLLRVLARPGFSTARGGERRVGPWGRAWTW